MSTIPTQAPATANGLNLDRLGMILSSACAVHCVLMPFALGALAYFGAEWVASETAEWALLGSALLVALLSLIPSYLRHRNAAALAIFLAGFAVITVSRALLPEHGLELGLGMAVGGSLIAFAHYRNHRLCACCHAPVKSTTGAY